MPVPTTFGGVATLALGPARWLAAWQAFLALAASLAIVWSLNGTWFRAIARAAEALPDSAEIRGGELAWPDHKARILTTSPFLGVVVDPLGRHESSLSADVTLSLEKDGFAVRSLLGWMSFRYPERLHLPLGRVDFAGGMAAWVGPVLIAAAAATFVGLLTAWSLLAAVYGGILWMLAPSSGRTPAFRVAWRLAAAALLLPAVMMTAAIVLYSTRGLGLVGLIFALPLHIIAGWIYCLGGLARLPRNASNPFDLVAYASKDRSKAAMMAENPFRES